MKKALFILLMTALALSSAWAYDFSAVAPTGQTLYYDITSSTSPYTVSVTYPGFYDRYWSDDYTNCWSDYTKPTGSLTIPSTVTYSGITYSVTSIGDGAFAGCSGLTSVSIPNSVTSIGNSAFCFCSGLTSVTIPNSVTSIGNSAFYYCSGLTSVSIPNSVTAIGDGAFSDCSGLTSVTIPNSVTSIGDYAFYNCSSLSHVTFNARNCSDPSSSLDGPFVGCTNISSVTIGDSVQRIPAYLFYSCSNLTDVTIGNSVTSIGNSAFYYCSGLTSVTIPNSVTSIGEWAFYNCSGLTSVTIPNSVTSIGEWAFWYCSGLSHVTFNARNYSDPSSSSYRPFVGCTNISSVTIGDSVQRIPAYLFYSCSNLTDVTIPNSVISIGDSAFADCSGLTSVTIPNSVTSIGNSAFSSCSGLTSVTIPNSVTSIGGHAFSDCSGLTSVTIPISVTTMGGRAFYRCVNLTSVAFNARNCISDYSYTGDYRWCYTDVPFENTNIRTVTIGDSVQRIPAYLFWDANITNITIPNSVTSIGAWAFYGCNGLTSVTIPNSVTSIGDGAFYFVKNIIYHGTASGRPWGALTINGYEEGDLIYSDSTKTLLTGCRVTATSVTIPNSVTSIGGGTFAFCSRLTNVVFNARNCDIGRLMYLYYRGDEVEYDTINPFYLCRNLRTVTIGDNVQRIPTYLFKGCSELTSVVFDARNYSDISSSNYTPFSDCTNLSTATIGDSVQRIPAYLFNGCRGLTSVTIPNSVTSIGNSAFSGCSGLTSVTIPNSVTSIGNYAFSYCRGLTEIISEAETAPTLGTDAFSGVPTNIPVYIPCGSLASYQSEWLWFSVFREPFTHAVQAVSDDYRLGSASILQLPTCANDAATVLATPSARYTFDHWSDGTTQNPYTLTLTQDTTLTAFFACPPIRPTDLPYTKNFDGYTTSTTAKTGVEPTCWTLAHEDVAMTEEYSPMIYYSSSNAHSGKYSLLLNKRGIYAMPEYEGDVSTLELNMYVKQGQAKYQLEVGVMDDLDGISSFVPVATIDNASTNHEYVTVDFSSYTGNGHYIAFHNILAPNTTGEFSCNYIDDLTLKLNSTACRIKTADLPYREDFDGYTTSTTSLKTGVEPPCWRLAHKDVSYTDEYRPMIYYLPSNAHSGRYSLLLNKRGVYAMPQYEGDVNTLRLSMYVKQSNAAYQLIVGVMTDLDDVSTFVPVATIDNATTGHELVTVDFNSYTGNGHYIAFRNTNASATSEWGCNYIDDLTLDLIPEEPEYECGIRIADLPYTENFDSYTTSTTAKTGVEPDCWTLVHKDVDMAQEDQPNLYYNSTHANSGDYSLLLNKRAYYAMPMVEADLGTLQLSFYLKQTYATHQLEIGVMSDLDDMSTYVPLRTIKNANTTDIEHYDIDFSEYAGNGHYIVFHNTLVSGTSSNSCNYIDDITLTLRPDECGIRIADLPYTEDFDSYTTSTTAKTGVEPDCWTLAHKYVTMTPEYEPMVYYGSAYTHSGNYSLLINKRGIYAMPEFEGDVNTLQMSLYVCQNKDVYKLEVGVMSDLDDESTFVPVATLNNATTTEVTQYTVDFGSYTGTGKYIAFRNTNETSTSPNYSCNFLDDITLDFAPVVQTYTITAVADDNTMGVVTGSGEYEAGTQAALTAIPYEGYQFVRWSDGDVNNPRTVTVTASETYTAYFETATLGTSAEITMVTVENHHNRIYWNAVDDAVSYKIYREDPMADQFILVGYTSATATNWTDPTANANAHSYKYKISYVNTDGIESPLSAAHKTMHLTISKGLDNHTWNLVWSPYEGREYKAYQIYRGTSEYDMACIDAISSDGNITYTDENATSSTVYYQVAIVWGSSLSKGDDAIMSKSNIAHYTSDYTIATRGNVITIEGCEHSSIRIFDLSGRMLFATNDAAGTQDFHAATAGAYLVQIDDRPAQKVVALGM